MWSGGSLGGMQKFREGWGQFGVERGKFGLEGGSLGWGGRISGGNEVIYLELGT